MPIVSQHRFCYRADNGQCLGWQVWNGDHCECAPSENVACSGVGGGEVCDNFGNKYPSLCNFVVEMCRGELPIDHDIGSCGKWF